MIVQAVGVTIPASNLKSALAFYSGELGFKVAFVDEAGGTAVLGSNGGYIVLTPTAEVAAAPKDITHNDAPRALLLVPFCDRVGQRLEQSGFSTFPQPEPPRGGMLIDVIDPFGNRISLYSLGG